MKIIHEFSYSKDFVNFFNKANYEKAVLDIMILSKTVFPGKYEAVESQSNGECDYIERVSKEKFDAKLPFHRKQVAMLTDGKKHGPEIEKWMRMMQEEAASFNPMKYRDNPEGYIENTELYKIMKEQVDKDKIDESIVFFLPYPITFTVKTSVFLQATSDYMDMIYDRLKDEVDLQKRKIYVIYPADEENCFVVRNLENRTREFISYEGARAFFTHKITNISVND